MFASPQKELMICVICLNSHLCYRINVDRNHHNLWPILCDCVACDILLVSYRLFIFQSFDVRYIVGVYVHACVILDDFCYIH